MLQASHRKQRARGAIMVIAAFILVVVGAFMALSLNAGHGMAVKGELQSAADAGALAGVKQINGSLAALTGSTGAIAVATDFTKKHVTDPSVTIFPESPTPQPGNWDPATRTWTPLAATPVNLMHINAIRISAARAGAADAPGGGALTAWFGQAFLGKDKFDVRSEAIAYAGAKCPDGAGCDSPFVIRYGCLVTGDLRCDDDFAVGASAATIDSAGFSNPQETKSSVDTSGFCKFIKAPSTTCAQLNQIATTNGNAGYTATCGGKGGPEEACTLIRQNWPVGTEMRVPVVVYEGEKDPMQCMGSGPAQYGGLAMIVTTIKMKVQGVYCNDASDPADPNLRAGACKDASFAAGKCIALHTECDDTNDQPGACVAFGSTTLHPALGR